MNLTCFTGRTLSVFLVQKFMIVLVSLLQLICFPMMIDEGVKRWNFFCSRYQQTVVEKDFFLRHSIYLVPGFSFLQTFHNQLRSLRIGEVTIIQVFLSHNLCDFHPIKVKHARKSLTYFTLSLPSVPRDHHNKSMKNGFINLLKITRLSLFLQALVV